MTTHEEWDSRQGLELATPRQTARLFGRAMTLRCPHCGGGPVLQHWLKMRLRCGRCGIRIERGEHDYFVGSMMLNYVIAGTLVLLAMIVVLIARWPDVPWDVIQYAAPIAVLELPFVLFPFTKLIWLAFDLMLRPVTPAELEWHRNAEQAWETERDARRD